MFTKFQKKELSVIEAVKFTGSVPPVAEGQEPGLFRMDEAGQTFVQTDAGPLFVKPGEYVIRGANNYLFVMHGATFEMEYAPVIGEPTPET